MSAVSILDADGRLSIAAAARMLSIHVSTLHRWRLKGVGGEKLRFVKVGGRSYILLAELEAFIARLSDPPSKQSADADMARRAAAADARAQALGL